MQGEEKERKKKEKERLWGGDEEGEAGKESPSSPAVAELMTSLKRERLHREVTLALRTGLRDARANFSFLRIRGLRTILSFLRSVADSDSAIRLFRQTQSIPDLQGLVLSVLLDLGIFMNWVLILFQSSYLGFFHNWNQSLFRPSLY